MKTTMKQFSVSALAIILVITASQGGVRASTTVNLVVTPTSPVFDANNVVGVLNDAAPGFGTSSFASDGSGKTDIYFTPEGLFGRAVTLGEVASMSYWTKKGTTHVVDPADWFLAIYTKPYAGDVSTPTWYGDRIGAEPYFSFSLNDPAGSWNQWTTGVADNRLRFFESTAGAPGATFGSYTDPDWSTLISGNALSGDPYAGHAILFFSLQTGSAWAAGFTGQLDGYRIELTDGSVATINFEHNDYDQDGVPNDVDCNPNSDLSPTVVIGGCNSGVPNTLFPDGCTISDLIANCAVGVKNHGQFVSCVASLTQSLKAQGTITAKQKGAIDSCAGKSKIGQ